MRCGSPNYKHWLRLEQERPVRLSCSSRSSRAFPPLCRLPSPARLGTAPRCIFLLRLRRRPWQLTAASSGQGTYVKSNPITIGLNKIKQTLRDSFSALSKPNFESTYSFESSWRDLQDIHAFAPPRPQYFSNFSSNFLAFSKLEMLRSKVRFFFFKFRRDFRWFSWN